jgi:hypothetical protein
MDRTAFRRAVVLAFSFLALLAVLCGARLARADEPSATPLCTLGEQVLAAAGRAPSDIIGRPDKAQALADALAERYGAKKVPIGAIFVFAGPLRVAVFGFDAEGCLAAMGTMKPAIFNAVAGPLGLPLAPMPARAPDPWGI